MMAPSYTYDQRFGRYLLAIFDVLACILTFKIFASREGEHNRTGGMVISGMAYTNPFLIFISTRGNFEAITITLAMAFAYFYFGGTSHGNMSADERKEKGITDLQPCRVKRYIAYMLYGLWVHFRVFPIILLPMLLMYEFYSVKEGRWIEVVRNVL